MGLNVKTTAFISVTEQFLSMHEPCTQFPKHPKTDKTDFESHVIVTESFHS